MNKRIIFVVAGVATIVAIFLNKNSLLSAAARNNTLAELLNLNTTQQSVATVKNDFSNSVPSANNQINKNDDVILQAQKLIRKAEKEYLTEGWLHISSKTESLSDTQNLLPDGSPAPTKWTDDLWVLLDSKGSAIKAVTIQDTGDPNTTQISVFKNGIWTNISLGITSSQPETYSPSLDSGFLDSAKTYKQIVKLSSEQTTLDNGQSVVIFSIEEKYKNPLKIGKDTKDKKAKEIYGGVSQFYFAADTGLPVRTENYVIDSNGVLDLVQRIQVDTVEKVNIPPDDILKYFSQ